MLLEVLLTTFQRVKVSRDKNIWKPLFYIGAFYSWNRSSRQRTSSGPLKVRCTGTHHEGNSHEISQRMWTRAQVLSLLALTLQPAGVTSNLVWMTIAPWTSIWVQSFTYSTAVAQALLLFARCCGKWWECKIEEDKSFGSRTWRLRWGRASATVPGTSVSRKRLGQRGRDDSLGSKRSWSARKSCTSRKWQGICKVLQLASLTRPRPMCWEHTHAEPIGSSFKKLAASWQ